MRSRPRRAAAASLWVGALLCALVPVGSARASDDDGDEARVTARCGAGVTSKLKVKRDDGALEVELEVDQNRNGVAWRVAIVHERRVAWKGTVRTRPPSGSFTVERRVADLPGPDTITTRATGPNGVTCRLTATLAAS